MSERDHSSSGNNFLQNLLVLQKLVSKITHQHEKLQGDFLSLDDEVKADLCKLEELIRNLSQEAKRSVK